MFHDDVIKRKHFLRYWPFVWGIHRSPVNSPHKGQWRGALMFSLVCAWIKDWVNNREAGDLRRQRAHYDVTIMCFVLFIFTIFVDFRGVTFTSIHTAMQPQWQLSTLGHYRILVESTWSKIKQSENWLHNSWWRHQMETFSALLAICAGNSLVPGEFPTQRPVTRSFDAYFDLRPNKRLSKQSWGWWFETPSRPLWRYRNDWDIMLVVATRSDSKYCVIYVFYFKHFHLQIAWIYRLLLTFVLNTSDVYRQLCGHNN